MKIRRLTVFAKLLLSGAFTPPVIGAGSYVYNSGHWYIGGTMVAYGIVWATVAVIAGGIGSAEKGFTTTEYWSSLYRANEEIERLQTYLNAERALRESFQAAITDGDRT